MHGYHLHCFLMVFWILFFFFFQAEDGIRDVAVTGVQTCALPISIIPSSALGADGAVAPSERIVMGAIGTGAQGSGQDRKSTRLNSSHGYISYAVFCLKKKKKEHLNAFKADRIRVLHEIPISIGSS